MGYFRKFIFFPDGGNSNRNMQIWLMLMSNSDVLKMGFKIGFGAVSFIREITFCAYRPVFNNCKFEINEKRFHGHFFF